VILTTLYLADAKNNGSWHTRKGDLQRAFPLNILMVPSSSIVIVANGECLVCSGFSLCETVRFGSFEFITDYFDGLSLFPKRGDEGTSFVGSTCRGASTPQRAMIEHSTEEFLMVSSGEGSLSHPSPRRCSARASLAPATTTTWKKNTPATTTFPPRMVAPQPETNLPVERCHAHHEGQQTLAHVQHPPAEMGSAPPWHEPMLKTERILMVDFTFNQA
jgi:hypothetical protein